MCIFVRLNANLIIFLFAMKQVRHILLAIMLLLPCAGFAQTPGGNNQKMTPEERAAEEKKAEKEFREAIDGMVKKYEDILDLEPWQSFYVDSILSHDYTELQAKLIEYSESKMSAMGPYQKAQDECGEKIYESFHKILNEEQWAKYLKSGAAADKKTRDKRAAKRAKLTNQGR